jgi:prepilin-type N-terminal cleavage/methylation domain-containing protein
MIRSAMFKLGGLKEKLGSKSGVTLVELLVVMLIVVILAISLVPFLRDYIVRARYTAEAIPVIGDLRVKIELQRYEPGRLPGLKTNALAAGALQSSIDGVSGASYIQTYVGDGTGGPLEAFEVGVAHIVGGAVTQELLDPAEARHFANDIDVTRTHLTGRRLRPNHVFYQGRECVDSPGYAYAIGVFGDGNGLNAGSGFAVLEVVNTGLDMKLVAEWRRFVERGGDANIIPFGCGESIPHNGLDAAGGRAAAEAGYCHIGDLRVLTDPATTTTQMQDALDFLEEAGWEFTR